MEICETFNGVPFISFRPRPYIHDILKLSRISKLKHDYVRHTHIELVDPCGFPVFQLCP
jgi:hypothetical protein